MSGEDTMVPYMWIYSIDPFSGTQVLTGAMIMDGRTIRYLGRTSPFLLAEGPFLWLCKSHADSATAPVGHRAEHRVSWPMVVHTRAPRGRYGRRRVASDAHGEGVGMNKGQIRIVAGIGSFVHARSLNERGQIVPRCSAHRKTMKNIADMTVTADVKRVNCGACKAAIS